MRDGDKGNEQGGWSEWGRFVLKTLEQNRDEHQTLHNRISECSEKRSALCKADLHSLEKRVRANEDNIIRLQVKAALIGGIAASIITGIASAIVHFA